MLYLLSNYAGELLFEVAPFNTHQVERRSQTDFAVKPIMGAPPSLELMGEGAEEVTMSCRLFPEAVGGLDGLEVLRTMRQSGGAAHLMRGDGHILGWFAITAERQLHTALGAQGVGRIVDVEISLTRTRPPSAEDYYQPKVAGIYEYGGAQVLRANWGEDLG